MSIAALVCGLVIFFALSADAAFTTSPSSNTKARTIAADRLVAGHCANLVDIDGAGEQVPVVPCGDAHDVEIIADLGGDMMVFWGTTAAESCTRQMASVAGKDAEQLEAYVLPIIPVDPAERLNSRNLCLVASGDGTLTGSFIVGDAAIS